MPNKTIIHALLKEFVRGSTQPSAPALIGAVFVVAALISMCARFVTPARLAAIDPGYLMADDSDEDATLTSGVLRIVHGSASERSVVVVGDSAIREAITSDEDLSQRISAITGSPIRVHMLVAGAVGLWDAVAITDCIREHVHGLVVVEVSPFNLGSGVLPLRKRLENPRWPIDSRALMEEAERYRIPAPAPCGNFFLGHYSFFLARPAILLHVFTGPVEAQTHFFGGRLRAEDPDVRAARLARFSRWAVDYRENRGNNLEAYGRLVRRLRGQPDISVALVETVENPQFKDISKDQRAAWEEYRSDIRAFAAKLPVQYWDLNTIAKLQPDDFADLVHLRTDEARERYTVAFASRIAGVLREQDSHRGNAR